MSKKSTILSPLISPSITSGSRLRSIKAKLRLRPKTLKINLLLLAVVLVAIELTKKVSAEKVLFGATSSNQFSKRLILSPNSGFQIKPKESLSSALKYAPTTIPASFTSNVLP